MKVMLVLALVSLFMFSQGSLIMYSSLGGKPYTVTYDHRSFFINGNRTLLLAGSMHYPRSTPAMWPELFDLAIKNGLNTIQTYVFWNFHEPVRGVYDFSGRGDLIQFIQQAAEHNLFVNLRIGPYVCAEWDYGGFPIWLRDIPGIQFRTYNQPFMNEMASFVKYIVNMTRPYLASQGGNIIMAQIENEYWGSGTTPALAKQYTQWCGELASSMDISVPWIMCNGFYANNTIETCNSCDCDTWVADHWTEQPDMPPAWTENEGWFDQWGNVPAFRTTPSVAYSVARFVAFGGVYHNYYMWHGGNNYGLTASAATTTAYANDVLVDSLALPHEPKFSFLGALHELLAQYSNALLSQNPPVPITFSSTQDYLDYGEISFLSNNDTSNATTITLSGNSYFLPPSTVIIFDANKNILFNTSDVPSASVPHQITTAASNFVWNSFTEPVGVTVQNYVSNPTPLEHLAISHDVTDYVWYSGEITTSTAAEFVQIVSITSQTFSVYVDGKFFGANWNTTKECCSLANITINFTTPIQPGQYQIDILSSAQGIDTGAGVNMQAFTKGIVGSVLLGPNNITAIQGLWKMQQGLIGEQLQIYTSQNYDNVNWTTTVPKSTPITWYSTTFPTPSTPGTVALNITGLGKGHAFVNGNDLGRYWYLVGASCGEPVGCFIYTSENCDLPTQVLYHIPPDWLSTTADNLLVINEELGAPDVSKVSIVVVTP